MEVKDTGFAGLYEITPKVYGDSRGYFFESYNQKQLETYEIPNHFVQDNQSFSEKGVLRGLHFQNPPFAQGKLVRVLQGKVMDVVVDLRKGSDTFGKHYKCMLDDKTHKMLYVPVGFAHGFVALSDAIFFYKCTNFYNKQSEGGIKWNDPELNIDWEVENPKVSEKDIALKNLSSIDILF